MLSYKLGHLWMECKTILKNASITYLGIANKKKLWNISAVWSHYVNSIHLTPWHPSTCWKLLQALQGLSAAPGPLSGDLAKNIHKHEKGRDLLGWGWWQGGREEAIDNTSDVQNQEFSAMWWEELGYREGSSSQERVTLQPSSANPNICLSSWEESFSIGMCSEVLTFGPTFIP